MRIATLLLVLAAHASCASAQVIDFETVPGETPSQYLIIRDQFNVAPYWVTFELVGRDTTVGPRLAKVGPERIAFQGPGIYSSCSGESSDADKPALGEDVGCYFLTDDGVIDYGADTLRISYTLPVRQASGELLDIDGTEEWTITALAADAQTVLDTRVITDGDPGTGDGLATYWEFDLDQDIYFIEMWGEKPGGTPIGIAFDNFSPASTAVDLSVSKTGPAGPVSLGDTLSYTVVVENSGPGTATSVVVTDRLPQGVGFLSANPSAGACSCQGGVVECNLGTLSVGGSISVEIVGVLDEVMITNEIVVTASEYDLTPADNSDGWHTLISCQATSVPQGTVTSGSLGMEQNRPNPFNPATMIAFSTNVASHVRLRIFDAAGRAVKHLVDDVLEPDVYQVFWDGLNDDGHRVASGVYLYELESNGDAIQRKMVVLE